MGKKAKLKREAGEKKTTPVEVRVPLRPSPNWPLLALSAVGIVLTSYLSWTALYGHSVRGCSAGSGCDIVLTSRWAELFGFPTAVWGLLTYIALAATAFVRRVDRHWNTAWTISAFGLLYSLYLTTISLTTLDATCPYCLTSLALMTSIFVLTTLQRPAALPGSLQRSIVRTIPVGLAAILVLHLYYTGVIAEPPAAEDPMARALADHLKSSGAVMYGAFWCPHCQDQKAMFGRSATRLPYVECSPDGQGGPQAEECRKAGIESYPTWFINGKKMEEVMTMNKLSELTGFKWQQ